MTDADATVTEDLTERIRALEAENARLAAAEPKSAKDRPDGPWWRALVSALIIVIATILVPISIVTAWARVQLVDEEAFVATLAPLAADPAVQDMIIDETMQAITTQVDFDEITANVFEGIAGLGLPPRAEDALMLLQAPAANGLTSLTTNAVTRVVESEAFVDVWATATRAAHRALTVAATSDGGGLVVRTDDGVGIQLGAIVERVKTNLVDNGVGIAQLIPTIDKVVILGEGDNLAMLRTGYAVASAVGFWLPVITLGLFGLGILIARRRSTAIVGTGVGFAIGAGSLALGFGVGAGVVGIVAGDLDLSPDGLGVIYDQMVGAMAQTATVLALFGVFIAVLGWAMGRSRTATGLRGSVRSLNATARRNLAGRGLDTGGFGTWLARQKILVRTVIAVLAVLWLFALRPLSIGDIILVVLVAFAVAWILELLQRRDDEVVEATVIEPVVVEDAQGETVGDGDTLVIEPLETADAATSKAAASTSEDSSR
ncbi:hypothetical protein [Microbacterium sp. 2FI]|uniref:hypothetical protein n=1 Tax=Microbacterium sp. 2FI TaxID=2502193 RepID=UPI0010F99B0A|nr:hypothetical protein [Microbacterium sp. 2FI]